MNVGICSGQIIWYQNDECGDSNQQPAEQKHANVNKHLDLFYCHTDISAYSTLWLVYYFINYLSFVYGLIKRPMSYSADCGYIASNRLSETIGMKSNISFRSNLCKYNVVHIRPKHFNKNCIWSRNNSWEIIIIDYKT